MQCKDLGVKHIISSKIEHHAVTHTLDELEEQGVTIHYVKLKDNGQVDIDKLRRVVGDDNRTKIGYSYVCK